METIHILGMGVVGSFLARLLAFYGVEFTWSDLEEQKTAWKACTGSVCNESKDPKSILREWREYADKCLDESEWEKADRYQCKGGIWSFKDQSYHLDAQKFVTRTREMYKRIRRPEPLFREFVIQTAGTIEAKVWWWGWSMIVEAPRLERACYTAKVIRQNRYLYPKPNSDYFYLGSSLMYQKSYPRELDAPAHAGWFWREWNELCPEGANESEIRVISEPVQGWRPVGVAGKWYIRQNSLAIGAMAASGVKYGPFTANRIVRYLNKTYNLGLEFKEKK